MEGLQQQLTLFEKMQYYAHLAAGSSAGIRCPSPPPHLPAYEDYNVSKSFVIHHPRSPFSGFDVNAGYPTSIFSTRFGPNGSWHISLIAHPFLISRGWAYDDKLDGASSDSDLSRTPPPSPLPEEYEKSYDDQDSPNGRDSPNGQDSPDETEEFSTPKQVLGNLEIVQEPPASTGDSPSDDTFYIEATFNSDDELHGSVSFEFATMSGEILKSDSTVLIGGTTHTMRCSETEAATDHAHILVTVTGLLNRMLDGGLVQDVKYGLYRRIPNGEIAKKDIGYVYADRRFLSSKSAYFKNALHRNNANAKIRELTTDRTNAGCKENRDVDENRARAGSQEGKIDDENVGHAERGEIQNREMEEKIENPKGDADEEGKDADRDMGGGAGEEAGGGNTKKEVLKEGHEMENRESIAEGAQEQSKEVLPNLNGVQAGAVDMVPFGEDYDYALDSDLEDGDDMTDMDDDEWEKSRLPPNTITQVIHIPDVAYKTWKAMIFYLYTGNICFSPLKLSEKFTGPTEPKNGTKARTDCLGLQSVSSKSMYRLADKIGNLELEHLALQHIKTHLNVNNIWNEILSAFTSRYEKIKDIEMDFLIANWDEARACGQLERHLEELTEGKIPHARGIFSELFKNLKPEPGVPSSRQSQA